jgi:hypothetical protein
MKSDQIEVTNGDISKLAEVDERFRYLMQLNAAMRIIDERDLQIVELIAEIVELKAKTKQSPGYLNNAKVAKIG